MFVLEDCALLLQRCISGQLRSVTSHFCGTHAKPLSFQQVLLLVLRMPSMKKKVETEMGKAKAMIQKQLVPQGEDVVRHLALPPDGKPLDWILEEMDKMDKEGNSHTDYKEGKLSGAVYRE